MFYNAEEEEHQHFFPIYLKGILILCQLSCLLASYIGMGHVMSTNCLET